MFNYFRNFWKEKVIEETSSNYNPKLRVIYDSGKYQLDAATVNYSFGSLHYSFEKVFDLIAIHTLPIKSVLLLGLGAGSVIQLLRKEYHLSVWIDAVEIDTEVLRLAEKYFMLSSNKDLQIYVSDAYTYVMTCNKNYDLIVVDVFIDDRVCPSVERLDFLCKLKELLTPAGSILYNRICQTDNQQFWQTAEMALGDYEIIALFQNRMLWYTSNDVAL
jgi:spermidine synthase